MATIIGVGMQMTASAAGMTKGLSEADRALQLLQKIVDQNQQSLGRLSAEANKTSQQLDNLTKTTTLLSRIEIGKLLISGAQAIGSAFSSAASQVAGLVSSVNSSLDTLNDLSARTGIGVESLQGYSLAAKLAGVDAEQFATAVQKLGVQIGKADPGGAFDKSLKSLGLTLNELRTLAPEQQFSAIGQAISQLPTAADRAAAAVEIFGKQGAALAPLFRDGIASIDDLRREAEQLGVIVNQVQVNNIAKMNDAFDKVFATVQGIVGQVIGNLAPAVTDVTNQFLEFVKSFNGGEGGAGIANAITDALFVAAEQFANVFDYAVAQFGPFFQSLTSASSVFQTVSNVFSAVGNTFMAIVENLRATFNLFELAGNTLMEGLGNFLAGLGSWVSSDLEIVGKSLAAEAKASADKNFREMTEAAENYKRYVKAAAESAFNVFSGDAGSPSAAGKGAASQYIKGMQEEFARGRLPEVKVLTGIEGSQERLRQYLKEAGDGAGKFFQQSQATLENFQNAAEAGNLSSTEVKVMLGFMGKLNEKLDAEIGKRRQAAEAAMAQTEADQKRLAALLKPTDAASKVEEDLAAVYREQARVQEQLAAARASSSQADADQAVSRLAELDQIQSKLEDIQQANEQGFGDGFKKAFEATVRGLDDLINKAGEFGNEGAKAAEQLQDGIARAQERARAGILSREAYEAEVLAYRRLFQERIAQIDAIAQREQQRRDEAFQRQIDANERLNRFLLEQDGGRQKAEIAAAEAKFKREQEAAENLRAIEERIVLTRKSLEAARADGDLKAAKARVGELRGLQQLQKQERAIAQGRVAAAQQINVAQQQTAQRAADFQQSVAQANASLFQASQRGIAEGINQVNVAFARAAERQRQKFLELTTLGPTQVQTADVRTREGAALVLDLAANALDPRLVEAKMTNKILRQVAQGLADNMARIGMAATI